MIKFRSQRILNRDFRWGTNSTFGISGGMRVGKDTSGLFFRNFYGIETVALADFLKEKIIEDFYMTTEQVHGSLKSVPDTRYPYYDLISKKQTFNEDGSQRFWTPRELMQYIGKVYRTVNPMYWISALDRGLASDKSYSITDIRFPNEAEYFKSKRGAFIIKLERSLELRHDVNSLNDESETSLNNYTGYDYIVENNYTTLEPLYDSLETIARELGIPSTVSR